MSDNFQNLTTEQKVQVKILREKHTHKSFNTTIKISGHGHDNFKALKDFSIHKGVWNPEVVASVYHASFLYYNNIRLFYKKDVLDMGTGTGLMGIVMGLHGANSVTMGDISKPAIINAEENIQKFGLRKICKLIEGNLFENIKEKFDLIVFNHPYFESEVPKGDTIAGSIMMPGENMQKFLKEAVSHLKKGGIIMMPYFKNAGDANDPSIQGPENGFDTRLVHGTIIDHKLDGQILIYELRKLKKPSKQ